MKNVSGYRAAGSVNVAGTSSSKSSSYTFSYSVHGSEIDGTVTMDGSTLHLVETGGSLYIDAPASFSIVWTQAGVSAASVSHYAGKWIDYPWSGESSFTNGLAPSDIVADLRNPGSLAAQGTGTIAGQGVVLVRGNDADGTSQAITYAVATSGPAYVLRETGEESGASAHWTVTFSDWNSVAAISPPPASVALPSPSSASSTTTDQPAPASVLAAVTGVSPSVSSTIGAGGVADPLEPVSGSPAALTGPGSKPELFYYGAEFCPYCAAERWSVVIALSRFGTFSNLHITMSDSNPDDIPDTHSFTFDGSSYSSSYLDFAAIESADRNGNVLQTPTAAEGTLVSTYDTTPYSAQTGGIPFQDLGNRYIVSGSGVNPELLQGMSWQQIAATLTDATSPVAQPIIGDANWLTAGICKLTGDQPGSVCSAAPIASLESQLGSSGG